MGLYSLRRRKREEMCIESGTYLLYRVPKWNNGKIQISEKQKSKILIFKSFILLT